MGAMGSEPLTLWYWFYVGYGLLMFGLLLVLVVAEVWLDTALGLPTDEVSGTLSDT